MMWDRVIDFPEHPVTLRDVLDILMGCLDAFESETFAEQMLAGLKGVSCILEECDYELDV